MCIAILSTAHPEYALILIDNRDEFLNRPTASASWWAAPHSDVLGGRDLLRKEQGTWLGVTKSGKIAVLTNFREDVTPPVSAVSRGALIKHFLIDKATSDTRKFVDEAIESGAGRDAGGFSLVCGNIGEPLAVLSNRAKRDADVPWILQGRGEIVGLSNAAFGNLEWKKVTEAERLLGTAIKENMNNEESEDEFVHRLLELLSTDTLPRYQGQDAGLETYINQLRNSIFVPALGRKDVAQLPPDAIAAAKGEEKAEVLEAKTQAVSQQGFSGLYGTQKQTVVLAKRDGRVRFFERSLHDSEANPIPLGQGDLDFVFQIDR